MKLTRTEASTAWLAWALCEAAFAVWGWFDDRELPRVVNRLCERRPAFCKRLQQQVGARSGDALAAQAAIAAIDEARGWRDAKAVPPPNDGTAFLSLDAETGVMQVMFWEPMHGGSDWYWAVTDGATYHKEWPTHWQPLPARPGGE